MLSNADYELQEQQSEDGSAWERITRRMVDPVTFETTTNVEYYPRTEECWHETNGLSISQPRLPVAESSSSSSSSAGFLRQQAQLGTPSRERRTGTKTSKTKRSTSIDSIKSNTSSASSTNSRGLSRSSPGGSNRSVLKPLAPPKKDGFAKTLSQAKSPTTLYRKEAVKFSSPVLKSPSSSSSNNDGNAGPSGSSSLGDFFVKDKIRTFTKNISGNGQQDDHSLSSRSMSSRSVADRSLAERSKSEESLKDRSSNAKAKTAAKKTPPTRKARTTTSKSVGSSASIAMHSIDEDVNLDDSDDSQTNLTMARTKTGLGRFLSNSSIMESEKVVQTAADMKSVASASTLGSKSISQLSQAELSRSEKRLKDKEIVKIANTMKRKPSKSVLKKTSDIDDDDDNSLNLQDVIKAKQAQSTGKKFRFQEDTNLSEFYEVPELTNSMYDDLFYTEDELADFRYEAFLEEAGLDVNEFM